MGRKLRTLRLGVVGVFWAGMLWNPAPAAIIQAQSPARDHVQASIDLASDGDTVIVPAGTATWTERVTISGKAITLQGAGIGNPKTTIINTQGDGSGTPKTDEFITFRCDAPANGRLRITGFEVQMSNTAQGILVYGPRYGEFRVDNCKFVGSRGRAVRNGSLLRALYHDCIFVDNLKTIDSYGGGDRDWSWQNPLTLGTINGTVVEDCEFRYETLPFRNSTAVASHGFGSRATWRHNAIINNKPGLDFFPCIDAHGNQLVVNPDNTGGHRGSRSLEFYDNVITSNVGNGSTLNPVQIRAGTFLCFNNTYTGSDVTDFFQMREEDGNDNGGRFNFIDPDAYPGYDMHWVWIWNNTLNGTPMRWVPIDGTTGIFVVENTNLFMRAPQAGDPSVIPGRQASTPADNVSGYAPLAYPHPWRGAGGGAPPAAPSGAGASVLSQSSILLTWTDNANDETQFHVERQIGAGGFTLIASVGANEESFTDVGLTPSTIYSYRVKAVSIGGDSSYSNVASATTFSPSNSPPAPPSALSASGVSPSAVALSWADNSNDEESFVVERSLSSGAGFVEVTTTSANVTTYEDGGLDANTTYYYRVKAANSAGDSAYTGQASATTPGQLVHAVGDTVAADTGGVWTAPFQGAAGDLSQEVLTTDLSGGRASFLFNIVEEGEYALACGVIAPDASSNSFFVNVDAEPIVPYSTWHIPETNDGEGLRVVSWQGNATGTQGSEFIPKYFFLGVGQHEIIFRGREANAVLRTLSLVKRPGRPSSPVPGAGS